MFYHQRGWLRAAVLGVGLTVLTATPAPAQFFRAGPTVFQRRYANYYAYYNTLNARATAANIASYYGYYPYYYSNPYVGYGYADVYAGYLRGAATAYALQANRAPVYNRPPRRQAGFQEYDYERLSPQEMREQSRLRERDRSLGNVPVNEVYSAKALNALLLDIQKLQGVGANRLEVTSEDLDPEVVRHINVTQKNRADNVGLLRDGGERLFWPAALSGDEIKAERERLNEATAKATAHARKYGRAEEAPIKQMEEDVERIDRYLSRQVADTPPAEYIPAKRFLRNLGEAVRALRFQEAGFYFTGKYAARGATTEELVRYMTGQGLKFAPAVDGDEAAYLELHKALAAYDTALQGLAQGK